MRPAPGYDYRTMPGYEPAYVWDGWDGVNRVIHPGGRVVPPFPPDGPVASSRTTPKGTPPRPRKKKRR